MKAIEFKIEKAIDFVNKKKKKKMKNQEIKKQ